MTDSQLTLERKAWATPGPLGLEYNFILRVNDVPEAWSLWLAAGEQATDTLATGQWSLGDWALAGNMAFGERWTQAIDRKRHNEKTLRNYMWVAGKFAQNRRRRALSFSHHSAVAALDPSAADELLDTAIKEDLTVQDVEDLVAEMRGRDKDRNNGIFSDLGELVEKASELLDELPAEIETQRLRDILEEFDDELRRVAIEYQKGLKNESDNGTTPD